MNILNDFILHPQTKSQKAVRDFVVLMVGTALAYLANNATDIFAGVNDATGGRIPAVLISLGLTGLMFVYRAFRDWSARPVDVASSSPPAAPPA
jgi:hypothetical protein